MVLRLDFHVRAGVLSIIYEFKVVYIYTEHSACKKKIHTHVVKDLINTICIPKSIP